MRSTKAYLEAFGSPPRTEYTRTVRKLSDLCNTCFRESDPTVTRQAFPWLVLQMRDRYSSQKRNLYEGCHLHLRPQYICTQKERGHTPVKGVLIGPTRCSHPSPLDDPKGRKGLPQQRRVDKLTKG